MRVRQVAAEQGGEEVQVLQKEHTDRDIARHAVQLIPHSFPGHLRHQLRLGEGGETHTPQEAGDEIVAVQGSIGN